MHIVASNGVRTESVADISMMSTGKGKYRKSCGRYYVHKIIFSSWTLSHPIFFWLLLQLYEVMWLVISEMWAEWYIAPLGMATTKISLLTILSAASFSGLPIRYRKYSRALSGLKLGTASFTEKAGLGIIYQLNWILGEVMLQASYFVADR